jgi:D-methionine transport system substrate-binding protein
MPNNLQTQWWRAARSGWGRAQGRPRRQDAPVNVANLWRLDVITPLLAELGLRRIAARMVRRRPPSWGKVVMGSLLLLLGTGLSLSILAASTIPATAETIRVGVTPGPHAEIAEALVPVARAKGLEVKVVEFSDGTMINPATDDGELEANAFQHTPYLDQQNADRHLDIVPVARTVLLPIAGYSRRYRALAELPKGAQIAIPNDPSNTGRSLKLLEANGLIALKPGLTFNATEHDITDNPRHFRFVQLEQAQIPRSLEDVDLAVINTNYAIETGLNPIKDSLLREGDLSEYFCLIGVARKNADQSWVKTLVEAYRSPEVKAFVAQKYQGNILAGW